MAPRFGTDGIRGVAGTDLTTEIVARPGRGGRRSRSAPSVPFLIARDTRESGPELEAALVEGITRAGGDAHTLGVLPTPGLAGACADTGAAGAMISASHNPFGGQRREALRAGWSQAPGRDRGGGGVGAPRDPRRRRARSTPPPSVGCAEVTDAVDGYVARLVAAAGEARRSPVCAWCSTAPTAPRRRRRRPRSARSARPSTVIGADPDGRNINAGVGSTHPDLVASEVVAGGADAGLAFDGDADRVVAVDARGTVVDGDHILAILALDLDARGALRHRAIATTVMANLGLHPRARTARHRRHRHARRRPPRDRRDGGPRSRARRRAVGSRDRRRARRHRRRPAHRHPAARGDGALGPPAPRARRRRHEVPAGARERAGHAARGPRRRRRVLGRGAGRRGRAWPARDGCSCGRRVRSRWCASWSRPPTPPRPAASPRRSPSRSTTRWAERARWWSSSRRVRSRPAPTRSGHGSPPGRASTTSCGRGCG